MVKLYEFVVTGYGEFAYDMLRYDHCWPAGQEDASKFGTHHVPQGIYSVRLIGTDMPTVDRWQSFGWKVTSTRKIT